MVAPNEIKEEAKKIMDQFMSAMDKIDVEEDFVLIRDKCTREEGEGLEANPEFKRRFLNNASNTLGDAILAQKAAWEK